MGVGGSRVAAEKIRSVQIAAEKWHEALSSQDGGGGG